MERATWKFEAGATWHAASLVLDDWSCSKGVDRTTVGHRLDIASLNSLRPLIGASPYRRPGNVGATDLQRAAHQNGNVRENFGPVMMERRNVTNGPTTHVANQALTNEHKTHIHIGGEN